MMLDVSRETSYPATAMKRPFRVLLVNPYIYDVSAYGFWSAPLGLLQIGGILRENGMEVSLLDCLKEDDGRRKEDGRAPFVKEGVETPLPLRTAGKRFKRYGLSPEEVRRRLSGISPPDLVLVTCIMTYWYQGAEEVVRLVRQLFPQTKIAVGGLYVSLCEDHARTHLKEADLVVTNRDMGRFYAFLQETGSRRIACAPQATDLDAFPLPAFDLYDHRSFVPLLTSLGCVYACTYCAAPYLYPRHVRKKAEGVLREISHWGNRGISRFALYDDNFLFRADEFAKPLLAGIGRLPFDLSIYNPNALNASLIDEETARLLVSAHFREVRLGLETIDPSTQKATGGKVGTAAFETAVTLLSRAGFLEAIHPGLCARRPSLAATRGRPENGRLRIEPRHFRQPHRLYAYPPYRDVRKVPCPRQVPHRRRSPFPEQRPFPLCLGRLYRRAPEGAEALREGKERERRRLIQGDPGESRGPECYGKFSLPPTLINDLSPDYSHLCSYVFN